MRLFERVRISETRKDDPLRKEKKVSKIVNYLDANRSRLSSIPSIVTKVNEMSANSSSGAHEYAQVCEVDQAICMRLLSLANSAYYGGSGGNTIRTIKDAIVRIGFQKARDVIQSAAVSGLFRSREKLDSYSASELWINSTAVAIGNRNLCLDHKHTQYGVDPYLFGLLRNIGIPMLHLCFYNEGFKDAVVSAAATGDLLVDEEQKYIGMNHQEAGVEVARQWKLPVSLQNVIGKHHDPGVAYDDNHFLIHVTRTSEWAAFELGFGYSDFSEKHADFYEQSAEQVLAGRESYEELKKSMKIEMEKLQSLGWFSGLSLARVR